MAKELKDAVTREYTINLHKRLHGVTFKKRAPKAVKEIKKFAKLHMGTEDVRLDPKLNVELWKRGIQGVPFRLRLRISRKRNEDENAKSTMFSYVESVNVPTAKGLQTVVVEDDE
ncbi:ribosomal 60S subunit protein L31B [Pichia kluyveri]|uniref:Ribosomal 60S subunit protein L31B n=1 Tax=Pichia kluyveri TaxID=36015 RepID=A0AAV5R1D6_PICKL|nr:ribosomal 60S subunit protein L31B [Pichia kluyveri]